LGCRRRRCRRADEAVERGAVGRAGSKVAPASGVQDGEQRRLAAERVAAGSFHLHHVGAGIGEQLRAVAPEIPDESRRRHVGSGA
jgi:hypothetical protein